MKFPLLLILGALAAHTLGAMPAAESPAPGAGKMVVYQLMTRLFSNTVTVNKTYGTAAENGTGKFDGITEKALLALKDLGVTHVWFTGVIRHETMTDYSSYGLPAGDADIIKGRAGSPYAIKDYYDVDPDLAVDVGKRMVEFQNLVDRTHKAGLKVILDFVPNHVARSYKSTAKPSGVEDLGEKDDKTVFFSPGNNFYYMTEDSFVVPKDYNPLEGEKAPGEDGKFDETPAKVTGNDRYNATPKKDDWFETVKLNYGYNVDDDILVTDPVPSTWVKMKDILLYWASKKVDGFRCDMAEMVPVEFWAWAIPQVKKAYPGIVFIAEIYKRTIYEDYMKKGGFDYLYDKVGLYDTLRPLTRGEGDPSKISAKLEELPVPQKAMIRFLENHDEQRVASPDFAGDPLKALGAMVVTAALGQGPVLIYFGQEVGEKGQGTEGFQGEDGRTTIFDYWGVPAHQRWMNGGAFDGGKLSPEERALRDWYGKLLNLVSRNPALGNGEFFDLDAARRSAGAVKDRAYTWLRWTNGEVILGAVNFDLEKEVTITLEIPSELRQKIGLSSTFTMVDLLGDAQGTAKDDGKLSVSLKKGQGALFNLVKGK